MTFRPGTRLIWAGALLVVLATLTMWKPVLVWAYVAVLVVALVVAAGECLWLYRHFRSFGATLVAPELVARRREFLLTMKFQSSAPKTLPALLRAVLPREAIPEIYVRHFALKPGENVQELVVIFPIRGDYELGPLYLRVTGPLGFMDCQVDLPVKTAVKVWPETALPEGKLQNQQLSEMYLDKMLRDNRRRGTGIEFESLRDFQPGDDQRRIDWRTTARTKRLTVRNYQMEQHRDVMVALDCGRLMGAEAGNGSKLDHAVNSTLMLSRLATKAGDRFGLGVFDRSIRRFMPPVAGNQAYSMAVQLLYNVESQYFESDFGPVFSLFQQRVRKRTFIIVISDVLDPETNERYRIGLHSLAARHVVLFVALQTPAVWDNVKAPVEDSVDAARKTFSLRLLQERQRTLHHLERSGVTVLDVHPLQLTAPLLNKYIELRSRSAL